MRYWKTHQKKLIKTYLEIAYDLNCKITFWQNNEQQRLSYNAQLIKLDNNKIKFRITKSSFQKHGHLDKEKPLFCHINEVDVIFRKDQFVAFNDFVEFPAPGEVQVYEKRNKVRFYYKYQDHKNITFYSETVKPQTNEDTVTPEYLYSCVLVDISIAGAGMVIPKSVKDKILNDEFLYLQDITDQKLPKPFKTQIKYIEKYDTDDANDVYKVGIQFVEQLDSVSFKSITSIVEIKQKKSKGLDSNRFCGLDYEDQVAILNKIELTNKQLANNIKDNIDYLDRLRYMTTKMKIEFLQNVEHDLLANALRLSSKELIYELLIEVTPNMQDDFLEKLAIEKPASGICKAQDKIIQYIRKKEGAGEFVLDPKSFTTYV